ncbi:uncharacterized protein C8Q71DRAFT_728009 [Rhodofomes roseus]|uniref:Uncharacterized protein n=1 Tax=Rhodofomes roseus TaxID=34475 RepID=A0ABQ8JZ73_9APHY|nr:uncharacterized protein C8Q71DRAFT_728009 [Rhodofomes roseus]KAH9829581.1 hypothetical protein C8Q71DRAFT_728009 [Rhodofomes roseus]
MTAAAAGIIVFTATDDVPANFIQLLVSSRVIIRSSTPHCGNGTSTLQWRMLSQQLLRRTPFLVTVAALLLLLPICLARRKSPVARSSPACATSSEVAAAASGQQARLSAADTPAESLSRASSVISTTSATSVSKSPTNVDNAGPITGTASTAGTLSATSTTSFARVPSAPSQASSSAQSASVETIINESVVVYDSYLSGHTVYSTAKVFSSVTETVSASGEVITATSLQRVTIPTVSSPLSRQTSSSTGTRTTFAPSQSGTSIEPKPATPNRNTLRIAAALALGSLCILVLGFSLWCWRRRRKRAVLGDAADDSGVFVPYRIVPYTKARSLLADTNRAPSPVTENDIEEELEGVRCSLPKWTIRGARCAA